MTFNMFYSDLFGFLFFGSNFIENKTAFDNKNIKEQEFIRRLVVPAMWFGRRSAGDRCH